MRKGLWPYAPITVDEFFDQTLQLLIGQTGDNLQIITK